MKSNVCATRGCNSHLISAGFLPTRSVHRLQDFDHQTWIATGRAISHPWLPPQFCQGFPPFLGLESKNRLAFRDVTGKSIWKEKLP
jgi:hypothetical protein